MSAISNPNQYYQHIVPQQFAAAIGKAPQNIADQPDLSVTYQITGAGGGTFGLRFHGGRIDFVAGGIENSDLHTTMSIDDWRASVAGSENDPLVDYVLRRKVSVVKALKGTVRLELTRSSGGVWESTTIFNNQDEPAVTLRMTTDDYEAMARGDLSGQMAFLTGKLKFEGSLPLLMQLATLNS